MLTIAEQIQIFREARNHYGENFDEEKITCMCRSIVNVFKEHNTIVDIEHIDDYLPTFTLTNVENLAIKDDFEPPTGSHFILSYWWSVRQFRTRLQAFDSLIKQLKENDE